MLAAALLAALAGQGAIADPAAPEISDPRAREIVAALRLDPLPGESGYFGGVQVSDLDVASGGRTLKAHSSIYYLLTREMPLNYLHHLESDDVHVLLEGGPVDYFIFHPDGRVEQQTLGRDLQAGQRLMISVPGGCWKALRLHPEAPYALMANVLSPQWTPDRVTVGAGADFVARYSGRAAWASEAFLRELIGPNGR